MPFAAWVGSLEFRRFLFFTDFRSRGWKPSLQANYLAGVGDEDGEWGEGFLRIIGHEILPDLMQK